MTEDRVRQLFDGYVNRTSGPAETLAFYRLVDDPAYADLVHQLMDEYLLSGTFTRGLPYDQKKQVLQGIFNTAEFSEQVPVKGSIFPLWARWAAAVAAVLLVAVPGFYQARIKPAKPVYTQFKGEIAPGGNKAVLVLSDGRKLSLTDAANGKLAEQAGVSIKKTASGKLIYETENPAGQDGTARYNIISTPAGGTYQVVLPDGTRVWLNAASSLKYPVSFTYLKERRVELRGEAYFEVARQSRAALKLPFIVSGSKQDVEVLGTHFNINSYDENRSVETTLLEGSIKLSRKGAFEKMIVPGEQAIVNQDIKVLKVDTSTAVAWKNGLFKFDHASIYTVMSQFSRWYDIDVEYEGKVPGNRFSGEVYRNMNASGAFKILSLAHINFRIEAPEKGAGRKKIIIMQNEL